LRAGALAAGAGRAAALAAAGARAFRGVESLTARTADPEGAELAEAAMTASHSLRLLLEKSEAQLFVSAVSGDSSEVSSVGKLDEDVVDGKEQREGQTPSLQQQGPWDGVGRAAEWVYGMVCKGLDWVEEAGRALQGGLGAEGQPEALGATLSRGDLEHLVANQGDMRQVLETVRAWQLEEEELAASPASQLARMERQMEMRLEAQLAAQRQQLEQQMAQQMAKSQLLHQQQMQMMMQQTMQMMMQVTAGGGAGGGLDASGMPRSPPKVSAVGAAGGSTGVGEAAPSVVGSKEYCLGMLLDPEKGGFLGDMDGMTSAQLEALEEAKKTPWGRAMKSLEELPSLDLNSPLIVAACTGATLERASLKLVSKITPSGYETSVPQWTLAALEDPRGLVKTTSAPTAHQVAMMGGTADNFKDWVRANSVHQAPKGAGANLAAWESTADPRTAEGFRALEAAMERWHTYPNGAWIPGQFAALLTGDSQSMGGERKPKSGGYQNATVEKLRVMEEWLRRAGYIPPEVPFVVAVPPPSGTHHALNGQSGAVPESLFACKAQWAQSYAGKVVVDVYLMALVMVGIGHWLEKSKFTTSHHDLAAQIKAQSLRKRDGYAPLSFPFATSTHGDPNELTQYLVAAHNEEGAWAALVGGAAGTRAGKWLDTMLYPFRRHKNVGENGQVHYSLVEPESHGSTVEKYVLFDTGFLRKWENWNLTTGSPSLASFQTLEGLLESLQAGYDWEFQRRMLHAAAFLGAETKGGGKAGRGMHTPKAEGGKERDLCKHCKRPGHMAVTCFTRGCDVCQGDPSVQACTGLQEARRADMVPNPSALFAKSKKVVEARETAEEKPAGKVLSEEDKQAALAKLKEQAARVAGGAGGAKATGSKHVTLSDMVKGGGGQG
jgi:hypothetical protein